MNIAVISFSDVDVTDGVNLLANHYKDKNPRILLPVLKPNEKFTQSVLKSSLENELKITCFFESAVGLDHILKQADDITLSEHPVKESVDHLKAGDALAIVWDDGPLCHVIVHSIEDLALDTWDITDGLDELQLDDIGFDMDADNLHDEMISTMGKFVDLMCAFVASTVMNSLSEAVAEHIMLSEEDDGKKDIDPFNNLG